MTFKCLTCQKTQRGKLYGKKMVEKKQVFGTCGKCHLKKFKVPKVSATPIQKPQRTGRPKGKFLDLGKKRKGQLKKALMKEAKKLAGESSSTLIVETAKDLDDSIGLTSFSQVARNLKSYFTLERKDNRGISAAILTEGFSLSEGARMTGVSHSSIALGRLKIGSKQVFAKVSPLNPRNASRAERRQFQDFVFDRAPVRSGTLKERRLKFNEFRAFYQQDYIPFAKERSLPLRSYNTIRGWLYQMNIKRGKFDRYRCLVCFEGRNLERKQNRSADEELKFQKYQDHLALVLHQHRVAKTDKIVEDPRTLLCIFDYTTIHDLTTEKWRDMGVCIKYNGKTTFIDNFANRKHDHHMTISSWNATLKELEKMGISLATDIDKLIIWSDGGLKTKETVRYFQDLSIRFPFTVYNKYFAPYHGHSEADGHFGLGKMTMRRRASNGPIMSVEQVLEAFSTLKATIVQQIEVTQNLQDVLPLELQIRKWFEFKFVGGRCWTRERCGEGEWTENTIQIREEQEQEQEEKAREARQDKEEKEQEKERIKAEKVRAKEEKVKAKQNKEKEKQKIRQEKAEKRRGK